MSKNNNNTVSNVIVVTVDFPQIHQWSSFQFAPLVQEIQHVQKIIIEKRSPSRFLLENVIIFKDKVAFIFDATAKDVIAYMAQLDYTDPSEYECKSVSDDSIDKHLDRFGNIFHTHCFA